MSPRSFVFFKRLMLLQVFHKRICLYLCQNVLKISDNKGQSEDAASSRRGNSRVFGGKIRDFHLRCTKKMTFSN